MEGVWQSYGQNKILVVKPEIRRCIGRPRHRYNDNIKMDFKESGSLGCGIVIILGLGSRLL